jgi:hypothetical protein
MSRKVKKAKGLANKDGRASRFALQYIEWLTSAVESVPVMRPGQQFNFMHGRWPGGF